MLLILQKRAREGEGRNAQGQKLFAYGTLRGNPGSVLCWGVCVVVVEVCGDVM